MRPMGIFGPVNFPPNQGWGSPWTDGGNHPGVHPTLAKKKWEEWPRWETLAFSGPAGCCWCFLLFGIQTQEATPKAFLRMDKSVARKVDRIHGERINGEFLPAYKWVVNWGYNLLTIDLNFLPVRDILPCIAVFKKTARCR